MLLLYTLAAIVGWSQVIQCLPTASGIPYATIRNFVTTDILNGDDGMPPSPDAPLSYGKPVLHVDTDGNAIEEHNGRLFYYNDQYYMFAEKWACGRFSFFLGNVTGDYPRNQNFPPGDYGGQCGIVIYTSPDLTTWKFETLVQPQGVKGSPTKPKLLYSSATGKYVLWLKAGNELGFTGGLYYLTADSPTGPWSNATVATGDHLAHDFDIAQGEDGSHYIVTDAFRGNFDPESAGGSLPMWDVWVQKLLPDLTGVVGTNDTTVQVMDTVDSQGIGVATIGGKWYITGGPTCGNCEVPIQYLSASSPLGPWSNEAGVISPDLKQGTIIAERGCGGQNKGLNKLPTANGGEVVISAIWGYRTSPISLAWAGMVQHGDNSQAISSTYWYPLEFDEGGRVKEYTCAAEVQLPLVEQRQRKVPVMPSYQPDCRVRDNTTFVQTGLDFGEGPIRIPVFQRTDDLGPYAQDGPVMDAALVMTVQYEDGTQSSVSFPASDVSWAPTIVEVPLETGQPVKSLSLSTTATNGCYGVLAEPKKMQGSKYAVVDADGEDEAADAQVYVHVDGSDWTPW